MPLAPELERSYELLESTCSEAKKRKYNSTEIRRVMTEMCKKKTGLTPYPEQLDLAECMLLGLNVTCVAGTGWGKTLPFALPLFVYPRKIIVIISPLNALEADQKMGFKAITLNGTIYTPDIEKAVRLRTYSIILCSFRDVLSSPDFGKRVLGLHVDEAHCIAQWGGKFRPGYSQLEALAHDTMNIDPLNSFYLNLGNDHHNITWELDELEFLLPTSQEAPALTKTMLFFNDITLSMKAHRWFQQHLPDALHARASKKFVLQQFLDGDVDILLVTEAAGMVSD
ncbi:hypothetical protein V8D89_008012 [Ganoderma adspersum]